MSEQLGDRIKYLRNQKGLSQEDMAKLLDLNRSTYSNYENNIRTPKINTLQKIADKLNVSLNDILISNSTKNEASNLSIEQSEYIKQLVDADLYGDDNDTFLNEQVKMAELYDKYFIKLLQWRLRDINSPSDFFKIAIEWYMGTQNTISPITKKYRPNLSDEDVQELSILFERLFRLKEHEYEFFEFYQKEYGKKDYNIISKNFLTTKSSKEGE